MDFSGILTYYTGCGKPLVTSIGITEDSKLPLPLLLPPFKGSQERGLGGGNRSSGSDVGRLAPLFNRSKLHRIDRQFKSTPFPGHRNCLRLANEKFGLLLSTKLGECLSLRFRFLGHKGKPKGNTSILEPKREEPPKWPPQKE